MNSPTAKRTPANVTAKLLASIGSVFQENVTIKLEDIYVPKSDVTGNNNPSRYTIDIGNVNGIADSFRNGGQDLSLTLPVVEKLPKPLKIDGKIHTYRLVCGAHRVAASGGLVALADPAIAGLVSPAAELRELCLSRSGNRSQ